MKILKHLIIKTLMLILFLCPIYGETPNLTDKITYKKSEEIFNHHILHQTLTPTLIQRILSSYLQELDPTKTYLLANEVSQWESPSENLIEKFISAYHRKDFSPFEQIYNTMITAIKRRQHIDNQLLSEDLNLEPTNIEMFTKLTWAETEEALRSRIKSLNHLKLTISNKIANNYNEKENFQYLKKRQNYQESKILQNNDPIEQHKYLLVLFLKSLCQSLDNHTCYFTPQEASQFMIEIQQRLFGIGAQLQDSITGLKLVRLLEGGPALKSGLLHVNDMIIGVDHTPISGMEINEAVSLIRGPAGSSVTLSILRDVIDQQEAQSQTFDIEIIRDEIVLQDSRCQFHTHHFGNQVIGYIRLFSFYEDEKYSSAKDIQNFIKQLKQRNNLEGIILDLRDNAGGLLSQAVEVSGLFLNPGVIVSIKDSDAHVKHLRTFNTNLSWDGALVVLTNKGTASSSEIVAQTLQDYGRAILVGDHSTWGKGSYQMFTLGHSKSETDINPHGEYKVTRGLYYTTSGTSPQLTGAKVDIPVPGAFSSLEIGESFAKFPIATNSIESTFTDNLLDIHPFYRKKMLKQYASNHQQYCEDYQKYIPQLASNSQERLNNNTVYHTFLTTANNKPTQPHTLSIEYINALQLEETYHIMKDLILLKQDSTPSPILSSPLAAGD